MKKTRQTPRQRPSPKSPLPRRVEYGSDYVVDLLRTLGIEYAAFNPGATFRGIHDSLVNYGGNVKPEIIECCHEEISVAVAHGYAKAAGKPMAAIVHNVVGLQHATMAIFNAWCDRVPLLVLGATGPMDTSKRRPWIDWIHTALVQGTLVRDYVKWDDQPASLAALPESLLRAYRIACTGPAGPVYVCVDAEIQEERIREAPPLPDLARYAPPAPVQANPDALERAAELLTEAECPVIVADFLGSHPGAVPALAELAGLLAAPVVDKGNRFNFPSTHPLDLTGAETQILGRADVILALDVLDLYGTLTTTDRTTRQPEPLIRPTTKIIHISLNEMATKSWVGEYQKLPAVDIPLLADTSVALPTLTRLCRKTMRKSRRVLDQRRKFWGDRHTALRMRFQVEARRDWKSSPISCARLAAEVWEVIKKEPWVLVNGTLAGWARKLWDFREPTQYLGKSGGAGVGYGSGASIGAALAYRGTETLCVNLQSDGDLLYTPSSLWTAVHHNVPLLMVMHNNRSYYNSEEHAIRMAEARRRPVKNAGVGTRIETPRVDFVTLAQAFGAYGEGPIEDPNKIRPALQRALKVVKEEKRLALVDVICEPR